MSRVVQHKPQKLVLPDGVQTPFGHYGSRSLNQVMLTLGIISGGPLANLIMEVRDGGKDSQWKTYLEENDWTNPQADSQRIWSSDNPLQTDVGEECLIIALSHFVEDVRFIAEPSVAGTEIFFAINGAYHGAIR